MPERLTDALPDDIGLRVEGVLRQACDLGLTLATAESCTGGLLASLLTDVEGCSHAFDRGFVVYTNAAKHALLGVSLETLRDPGPVSEVVACQMAEGALRRSQAYISLAITGFAGRAGPADEPGLVHFAVCRRARNTRHRLERFGDVGRAAVRIGCIRVALDMLEAALSAPPGTLLGSSGLQRLPEQDGGQNGHEAEGESDR